MAPPIHVVLSDYVWKRKWWVYYLIVVDDFLDKNNIATTLPAEFENLTFQYAQDYIRNGKMPPADIAPAILNMADDYMAGRQVSIRAGDYIAIHNHMRNLKR
jgi:hypothetical protein